jgi:hypothetical protein
MNESRDTIEFLLSLSLKTLTILASELWSESQSNDQAHDMLHHVIMVHAYKVAK